MAIDNAMYDRLSHTWWEEGGFLNFLRAGVNSARFGYMKRVLAGRFPGAGVLDVGSGGGLLAEEFARLGYSVTGIDPSAQSVAVARAHASSEGLDIEYVVGAGESLPFDDASFPVVYCCDVLEHVEDLDRVVAEVARVLEPGGLFLYDTINRTLRSWLLVIKVMQDWKATAWAEPDLHDWKMFIKPRELEASLRAAGLEPCDRVGIAASNPVGALRAMRARARGRIGMEEMAAAIALRESRDQSASYAGYALKGSRSSR
jgi:2-polyprenyl-6-hydroxyphenyl methylase / 3-demethylubiquinone-9 3-methyltransferase